MNEPGRGGAVIAFVEQPRDQSGGLLRFSLIADRVK